MLRTFYDKYKNEDIFYLVPIVLLSLGRIVGEFFIRLSTKGFPVTDDSLWYLNYARNLLVDFKIGMSINDLLYLSYNLLLAGLLAIFKEPETIIFIQGVVAGLSVILVYKIALMIFNRTTAIIASLMYGLGYELAHWAMFILTDSFFVSLLLVVVYLLLMAVKTKATKYKVAVVASSLYMLLFRPTGCVSLFFMLIYLLIVLPRAILFNFVKKYALPLTTLVVLAIALPVYAFSTGKLDPLIESLAYNGKLVLYNIYAFGWVHDIPSTYDYYFDPNYEIDKFDSLICSFLINNWSDILVLYYRRAIIFLGNWPLCLRITGIRSFILYFSNALPALLFFLGLVWSVVNKKMKDSSILWLMVLAIFIFCVVLFIDSMYRYRMPAMPFISIISAYGLEQSYHKLVSMVRKRAQ